MPTTIADEYVDCCPCLTPYKPIKKQLFVTFGPLSVAVSWSDIAGVKGWRGTGTVNLPYYGSAYGDCHPTGYADVEVFVFLTCSSGVSPIDGCLYGGMSASVSIRACAAPPCAVPGANDFVLAYTSVRDPSDTLDCNSSVIAGDMRMLAVANNSTILTCMQWDYDLLPWGGTPPGRPGSDCCWDFTHMGDGPRLYWSEL
jgi:hypothetical protein